MSLTYCGNLLRQQDTDRFLLSLFAPGSVRSALWALFAFNHELVKTRAVVSDTRLGLIRLQWWRDEICRIYEGGDGGQTPILSTLATVIHQQTLPQEWFEALLYAREFDLEDVAPASMEGLRNYADFTTTPLNQLALKMIGEEGDLSEIRAISTNFGVMETIRRVPFTLSEGRCLLPEDLLRQKKLTPKKIIDYNHQKDIQGIISLMDPSFVPYRKPKSRFLDIQQRMTFIHLKQLEKNDFDVFSSKMRVSPPFLAARLTWPMILRSLRGA